MLASYGSPLEPSCQKIYNWMPKSLYLTNERQSPKGNLVFWAFPHQILQLTPLLKIRAILLCSQEATQAGHKSSSPLQRNHCPAAQPLVFRDITASEPRGSILPLWAVITHWAHGQWPAVTTFWGREFLRSLCIPSVCGSRLYCSAINLGWPPRAPMFWERKGKKKSPSTFS